VIRRLRVECPWDREQTHESLRRHLLEETYEVLEAIDHLDVTSGEGYGELEEELGDLLIQIYFHATLAAEQGQFDLADVARVVRDKMVVSHPHVFGDDEAETADDVRARWEKIKQVEKGRESVMDGIPVALPALLYALKVQKRAASARTDWRTVVGDDDHGAESGGPGGDLSGEPQRETLGWRLMELVDEARLGGADPETELRLVAERVRDRFVDQE
jgi:MazG family protein